ncbi:MAG TPA: BACON domain-containing protein, partial [Bacteroidota bacterium]
MQSRLRHLFFLPLLLPSLAGQLLHAQSITITASDVQAQLAPGMTLTNHNDSLSTQVNIGRKGASSWDFSTLRTDAIMVYTSVPVATTPYVADFPGATNALQATLSVSGITGTAYQYLILGNHLMNPGLKGEGSGIVLTTKNTPLDTTYFLPSTYGSAWKSTFSATTDVMLGAIPLSHSVKNYAYVYTVDGYGPMKIPDGTTHQSLRIRKVNTVTGGVGYIFLARDGASVQLNAASAVEPDSGLINVGLASISWTPASLNVPVAVMALAPSSLNVDAPAATVFVRVSNTGTGPLNWNASANDPWLAPAVRGSDSIAISCQANPGTSPRTGTITVTSNAINSPQTITVTQAGVPIQPVLAVSPDTLRVPSQAGSAEFTVQNTGTGTMNWTAASSQSWAVISEGASGTDAGKVKVTVGENNSIAQRAASVTVTAPGATASPKAVTIVQAGVPVQTVLSVTPDTVRVPWQAGVAEFTVRNTGNGTMHWSAASGQPWAVITEGAAGNDSGKIKVSIEANPSVLQRIAAITVTASGATGSPKQVLILQDSCEAPRVALLIAPADGDTLKTDSVRLLWHRSSVNTTAYWLEVSFQPQDSTLVSDSTLTDTSFVVKALAPGSGYRWHVRSKNPTGWSAF